MVTFPIYQFSNILSQNIEKKFWGYPPFGPLKIIAYENDPTWPPITPIFKSKILFYTKNGDVCKKVELNILRIGQLMAILSSKKGFNFFLELSRKFCLARENCYNSANFKDNLNFFSLHDHW